MSNYTLQRSPATYSAAAGVMMLAAVLVAQATVDAMDSFEAGMNSSTLVIGKYRESGVIPTTRVNAGEAVVVDENRYFSEASQTFVAQFSGGFQPLGAQFSEVLEDNFWDLVLG